MATAIRPPGKLDDAARAELLCYLVVGQLVAHARAGEWLRTGHLVESARIWLASNGANCDWHERVTLSRASAELAPAFLSVPLLRDDGQLARLFTDGWRLDYRSPVVREIHDACEVTLLAHRCPRR
jgi:hypothetical protein